MLAGWHPFPVEDPLSLGVAALALHAAAAETSPLTIVVDDVHWADEVSLESLAFAWRRLALDPVAVIVTSRPPLPDVLAAIAQAVTLDGLSAADGVALLRANTTHSIDPAVASVLVGQARGNPLALTELPRILTPEQLAGRAPLPSELPIGPQAAWSFAAALQSLPERALSALTVVALAGAAAPNHAVAAMERLGLAPSDLAPATEAQLCAAGPGAIAVRHPLVAAAIGEVVPIDARRRVHDALHEACRDAGDEERSAWHLAATVVGASEETAAVVEAAAASIRSRRGPVAAAALQRKAAELTPAGPERARRLLLAAHDALAANRPVDVLGICAQIEALDADPRVRGQAVLLKAEAGTWSAPPVGLAGELWDLAGDEELGLHALAALLPLLSNTGEIEQLHAVLDHLEALEGAGQQLPFDITVLVSIIQAILGDRERARELVTSPASLDELASQPFVVQAWAALAGDLAEEHERALALAREAIRGARRLGHLYGLTLALTIAAQSVWWLGRWDRAEVMLDEALRLCDELGLVSLGAQDRSQLARLAAARGDGPRLEELVAAMPVASGVVTPYTLLAAHARGLLALGLEDLDQAVAHLSTADSLNEQLTAGDGLVLVPYAGDLIEALTRAGHEAEARAHLDELTERAARQRSPWGAHVAARCRALLTPVEAEQHFVEALAVAGDGLRFERARTLLAFGERLRRERRPEAADRLLEAHTELTSLGARPWAARAAAELRALRIRVGQRVPAASTLTPQELRVCLAVATGASNREVASMLFLSAKTVEAHLSHAFRKLGLTSRSQLAALVASGGLDGTADLAGGPAGR